MNDLLAVQSGVYSYLKGDKIDNKTRGFAAGNVATMGGADLEAIERRMELEGVPDNARKMLTFREALLNKVPAAWRQAAFKPDGSVNLSPEIVLMPRTFKTAGAAVASLNQFDLIGRWASRQGCPRPVLSPLRTKAMYSGSDVSRRAATSGSMSLVGIADLLLAMAATSPRRLYAGLALPLAGLDFIFGLGLVVIAAGCLVIAVIITLLH